MIYRSKSLSCIFTVKGNELFFCSGPFCGVFDLAFDACLAKFTLIEIISLLWTIVHQSASQSDKVDIWAVLGYWLDWRVEKHFLKQFKSIFQYICQNQLSETAISADGLRVTSKSVMFCTRPESQCWTFGSPPKSQMKLFYGPWFVILKPDIGILLALIWHSVWLKEFGTKYKV